MWFSRSGAAIRARCRIDEIEQHQPGDPLRRLAGQRLHHGAADVVADHAGLVDAEGVEQRQHVVGMLIGAVRAVRFVAVAEAAQVGRDQGVAVGEPRHDRLPGQPELRPAMQQQQRPAAAGPRDVERRAVGSNRHMIHGPLLLPLARLRAEKAEVSS
jgi:hypothetical protein